METGARRRTQKVRPMDTNPHTMANLFAQLGLPDDSDSIDRFVASHRPLGNEVALYRAPF